MRAVLFDFFGTLGYDRPGSTLPDRLAACGYRWEAAVEHRHAGDGDEHPSSAESRDAYEAFRRPTRTAMLLEMGVPRDEVDAVYEALYGAPCERAAYDDVEPVLRKLRDDGLALAICSNWDWDLDVVLDMCGITDLVDARVTSARVGCRKPHRRIFEHTLDLLGVPAADAVYVGDSPHADVEGPLAIGLRPVHIWRWPGPRPPVPEGVPTITTLDELPALL